MGIDEGTPSQLAPSVGTIAAGSTVSAASSEGNNSPIYIRKRQLADKDPEPEIAEPGSTRRIIRSHDKRSIDRFTYKRAHQNLQQISYHTRQNSRKLSPDSRSGLDLAVGSFNFFVNNLGMQDLTGPKTQTLLQLLTLHQPRPWHGKIHQS